MYTNVNTTMLHLNQMAQETKAYEHTCKRCYQTWVSLQESPVRCGKCKSPYWDKRRVMEPRLQKKQRHDLQQDIKQKITR